MKTSSSNQRYKRGPATKVASERSDTNLDQEEDSSLLDFKKEKRHAPIDSAKSENPEDISEPLEAGNEEVKSTFKERGTESTPSASPDAELEQDTEINEAEEEDAGDRFLEKSETKRKVAKKT